MEWLNRFRPLAVSGFCLLTLFIWGNRVWLAWTNPDDSIAAKIAWSVPITFFVIAAAVLLGTMASRLGARAPLFVPLTRAFAAVTVVFWAVRAPMISLADHPVPFKVVHGVLAVVSIAAAVAAWRAAPDARTAVATKVDGQTPANAATR